MTSPLWSLGASIGLVFGLGSALVWWRLPWRRRPALDERLGPYLRDAVPASRLLAVAAARSPFATLERLLAPVMADAVGWVERISGGSGSVRLRLDQLGSGQRVEQFRAEQVVWGALGAGAGAVAGMLGAVGSGGSVIPLVGLVVGGCLLGVLGRDQVLSSQVRRREQRMLAEFPAVAELIALAVGAGEGAVGALERVARTCHGELSVELRRTLADARAGASLVQALERLAARTGLPVLARFVDGLAVAIERGTPLGEVLRAQAHDVRELSRRRLIETGGKKEIAMMVPVVFLVLPVTVLFAVFPGLAVLEFHI